MLALIGFLPSELSGSILFVSICFMIFIQSQLLQLLKIAANQSEGRALCAILLPLFLCRWAIHYMYARIPFVHGHNTIRVYCKRSFKLFAGTRISKLKHFLSNAKMRKFR